MVFEDILLPVAGNKLVVNTANGVNSPNLNIDNANFSKVVVSSSDINQVSIGGKSALGEKTNEISKKTIDAKPSYASVVNGNKIDLHKIPIVDLNLDKKQSHKKEGHPAILFTKDEIQRTEEIFKFTLVAKFINGKPSMDLIRKHIATEWGLTSEAIVGLIDYRHILIKLNNPVDLARAWAQESQGVVGYGFKLFKWKWDFKVEEEPHVAPVWIKLPKLPINFCIRAYLNTLVQDLGPILAIDLPTLTFTRPQYARVCVEMNLLQPREDQIWVGLEDGRGFWQDVEYEKVPKYCTHCAMQGHDLKNCYRVNNVHKNTHIQTAPIKQIPKTMWKPVNKKKSESPRKYPQAGETVVALSNPFEMLAENEEDSKGEHLQESGAEENVSNSSEDVVPISDITLKSPIQVVYSVNGKRSPHIIDVEKSRNDKFSNKIQAVKAVIEEKSPQLVEENKEKMVLTNSFAKLQNNLDDEAREYYSKENKEKKKKEQKKNAMVTTLPVLVVDSKENFSDSTADIYTEPDISAAEILLKNKFKDIKPFGMKTRGNRVQVKF